MLISVQKTRRDTDGSLIATILDGRGGTEDLPLGAEDAVEVERVWAQNLFHLQRYEQWGAAFPAPASIPVEISDKAA